MRTIFTAMLVACIGLIVVSAAANAHWRTRYVSYYGGGHGYYGGGYYGPGVVVSYSDGYYGHRHHRHHRRYSHGGHYYGR